LEALNPRLAALGKLLAKTPEVSFIELDRMVEQEYGMSIGEILALHGQAGYLRQERHCLDMALMQHKAAVIEDAPCRAS